MALFDAKKLKDAAWKRFERKIRSGRNEDESRRDWVRDSLSIDAMEKVCSWLKDRGISLHIERRQGAAFFQNRKYITLSSAYKLDVALVYLLHECGHALIGNGGAASKRYSMGYPKQHDPKCNKKFAHRLAVLDEEVEAWHRGKKLAKRLKIAWSISERLWEEKRLECLKSYVTWTIKPSDFKDHASD